MLKRRQVLISASALAITGVIPLGFSQSAFATGGGNTQSTNCTDSSSDSSSGFNICYNQQTPGNPSATPTNNLGTPNQNGKNGKNGKTITYTVPKHCSTYWSTGQVTADCEGSKSVASSNLNFWGSPNQTTKCIKIDNFQTGPTISCTRTITFPGTPGIPPKKGTPPIAKNPYSGIPTALLAVFDALNVPTPRIGKLVPSTNPWTYTNYPTQVSIAPGSLPPTLTSSKTTTSISTVDTTWDNRLHKWNTKKVPISLTATITAHLIGTYWIPEARDVNGRPNVTTPPGGVSGAAPGSVICGLGQNSTSMSNDNNVANSSICEIEFTQPSTKAGWTLQAEGIYAGSGTITENGKILWSGSLGDRFSNAPASIQVPVAVLEAVDCTTANCVNAGLAPINDVITPWGTGG